MRTRIGGVLVSVLSSNTIDLGFELLCGQTKYNYKTGMCCFSASYAALRSKSKDLLARNQYNVSDWNDMSAPDCCFSELALQISVLI